MALLDAYRQAHYDVQFQLQVRMALLAAALGVLDEDPAGPTHAARLALAKRILAVPNNGFLVELTERACEVLALDGVAADADAATVLAAIAARTDQIATTFA